MLVCLSFCVKRRMTINRSDRAPGGRLSKRSPQLSRQNCVDIQLWPVFAELCVPRHLHMSGFIFVVQYRPVPFMSHTQVPEFIFSSTVYGSSILSILPVFCTLTYLYLLTLYWVSYWLEGFVWSDTDCHTRIKTLFPCFCAGCLSCSCTSGTHHEQCQRSGLSARTQPLLQKYVHW